MGITFNWNIILVGLISSFVELYVISRILNKKIFFNWKKLLIGIIIISSYQIPSYLLTSSFFRPIISLFVMTIGTSITFEERFTKSLISAFISWLVLLLSEVIFMSITTGIFKLNIDEFQLHIFGNLFVNFIIFFIDVIIINIPIIRSFSNKICYKFENIGNIFLIEMSILICLAFTIGIYLTYYKVEPLYALILNLIIMIIYILLLILLFNEKFEKEKIKQDLSCILQNLKEYEKMLDFQRVANHENKNQLLVIKGKINKREKDVIDYINTIIKDKREDNEIFYNSTKMIPEGGLQGLIYYKSLIIKEKNINLLLDIDRKIKNYQFNNLSMDAICSICKIAGVWIDNAIQATIECFKPEIWIEMKLEKNNLIFKVSNRFKGEIDVEKIEKSGYTTKGKGHGYGLYLVKEIIEKNNIFENQKIINGEMFTQKLIIKNIKQ